jgi:hypothetical protein
MQLHSLFLCSRIFSGRQSDDGPPLKIVEIVSGFGNINAFSRKSFFTLGLW